MRGLPAAAPRRAPRQAARILAALAPLAFAGLATPANAAELIVRVGGIEAPGGEVGCALFAAAAGFPTDSSQARQVWLQAAPGGVVCRFAGIPAGQYAVAVSLDLNGNRRTDRNFLGMPTEAWGVSNNVRPSMRAPTFAEALLQVPEGPPVTIEVRLAR